MHDALGKAVDEAKDEERRRHTVEGDTSVLQSDNIRRTDQVRAAA